MQTNLFTMPTNADDAYNALRERNAELAARRAAVLAAPITPKPTDWKPHDPYRDLAERMMAAQTPPTRKSARAADRSRAKDSGEVWGLLKRPEQIRCRKPRTNPERLIGWILKRPATAASIAALYGFREGIEVITRVGRGSMRRAAARYDANVRALSGVMEDAEQTYNLTLLAWRVGVCQAIKGFTLSPRRKDGVRYTVGQFLASHGAKCVRHSVRFARKDSNRRPGFAMSGTNTIPGIMLGDAALGLLSKEPTAIGGPAADDAELELARMEAELGSTAAHVARLRIRGMTEDAIVDALGITIGQAKYAMTKVREWYTRHGVLTGE